MINGTFKAGRGLELTDKEKEQSDIATKYLDQFLAANKVVFAFPLWKLTVQVVLHTYLDYLKRAGKTFRSRTYYPGRIGTGGGRGGAILNAKVR